MQKTSIQKNTESKIPKLRFPGFEGAWEEKNIGQVLKIGNGRDYKHLKKGDIPVFGTGGYMLSVDESLYSGESVMIGRKGTIDKPFYYNGDFWTVDTLFYTYDFNGILPKFTETIFKKINWQKYNEASGVPSLSKTTIEKIKINLPKLPEQQKIASFLGGVDEWIENLREQKKSLESYKKCLMQKIFSKQIRFKDENGNDFAEWEEKRFDELYKNISTKEYQIKNSEILVEGKYKVVDQGQDLISGYSNNSKKLFKQSPVIIFGDHTTMLKYIDFEFVIGADGTKILVNKNQDNIKFLYYLLWSNPIQAEGYKRHFSILKKGNFLVPSLSEQQKIAEFLSLADYLLESKQEQITQAEEWKNGLIYRLFV